MNEASLAELLSRHADDLKRGQPDRESYLAGFGGRREELLSLLVLAETLKRTLRPVRPSNTFRQRLGAGLQLAAHHQTAGRALSLQKAPDLNRWWMGAAALGASVAAGSLIAWVVRSRMTHSQPRIVESG